MKCKLTKIIDVTVFQTYYLTENDKSTKIYSFGEKTNIIYSNQKYKNT